MRKSIKAKRLVYKFTSDYIWGSPIIVARSQEEAWDMLFEQRPSSFNEALWQCTLIAPLKRIQNPITGKYEEWPKD